MSVTDLEAHMRKNYGCAKELSGRFCLDDENQLMLERDLLDQQIIDVHGRKVVRVNDVDLVWETRGGRQ